MSILIQFSLRMSFGLAAAMAMTSPQSVPSGFFRVHLYVLLGLNTLVALLAWQSPDAGSPALPAVLAALSYAGSAIWLYEKAAAGRIVLWLISMLSLVAACQFVPRSESSSAAISWLDPATGGLLLGSTMAAMLLGHWYLNTPTMQLAPLRKLLLLMAFAVAARALACGTGLALDIQSGQHLGSAETSFLALRWLAGIIGTLAVTGMAWQTLKIPNTQSATGILYVGVIVSFIGELTSQLLSHQMPFPL